MPDELLVDSLSRTEYGLAPHLEVFAIALRGFAGFASLVFMVAGLVSLGQINRIESLNDVLGSLGGVWMSILTFNYVWSMTAKIKVDENGIRSQFIGPIGIRISWQRLKNANITHAHTILAGRKEVRYYEIIPKSIGWRIWRWLLARRFLVSSGHYYYEELLERIKQADK